MEILIFILLLPTLLLSQSLKDMTFGNAIVLKVTSIYDGDTFRANIKGYPPVIGKRMSIRINGIDAPEIKAHCEKEKLFAIAAKKVTISLLRNAHKIELRNIRRGKYFRLIADVYADGLSIGNELLANNLAVSYDGKHKVDWCKYFTYQSEHSKLFQEHHSIPEHY